MDGDTERLSEIAVKDVIDTLQAFELKRSANRGEQAALLAGEARIMDFITFVETNHPSATAKRFLRRFARLMEIAGYVRAGGVKSMIYRLETGRRDPATGYFEVVSTCVERYLSGQDFSVQKQPQSASSLLLHLEQISADEEKLVDKFLTQIDSLMMFRPFEEGTSSRLGLR